MGPDTLTSYGFYVICPQNRVRDFTSLATKKGNGTYMLGFAKAVAYT